MTQWNYTRGEVEPIPEIVRLVRQLSPDTRREVLRWIQGQVIRETGGPQLPIFLKPIKGEKGEQQ